MDFSLDNRAQQPLIFLKLGGSLITDKARPRTALQEVLARLAGEIARAWHKHPHLQLLLGHGSGSFGHVSGEKHGTRNGVHSAEEWQGFAEVWYDAAHLNRIVIETLHQVHLPALAFPPSTSAITAARRIKQWDIAPLQQALEHRLLPVVYGDVTFDTEMGGTILSTEEIMTHLAAPFQPRKILLAGQEPGVWADYPQRKEIIPEITPGSYPDDHSSLQQAGATDVTGGMAGKVRQMLSLVTENPDIEVWIFSGAQEGSLYRALTGDVEGTRIFAPGGSRD